MNIEEKMNRSMFWFKLLIIISIYEAVMKIIELQYVLSNLP